MPIYNFKNKGRMGYSGVIPYTGLEDELYSQNTFTPEYNKWQVSGDFDFINGVLTFTPSTGSGKFLQPDYNFLTPIVVNKTYRIEWNLQNVTPGDLTATIEGINSYNDTLLIAGNLEIKEGRSHLDFLYHDLFKLGDDTFYFSVTGSTGSFEVIGASLRKLNELFIRGNFESIQGGVWNPDGNFYFNDDLGYYILTYDSSRGEGYGTLWQHPGYYSAPIEEYANYRFTYTVKSCSNLELIAYISGDGNILGYLPSLAVGTHYIDVVGTYEGDKITLVVEGEEGILEITNLSFIKMAPSSEGQSGFSGYYYENAPIGIPNILEDETSAESLVTNFNILLENLKTYGWMEEGPNS